MNPTPIYTEAFREAKRRTRRHSDERRDLLLMDERTNPWRERPLFDVATGEPARLGGRSTGPVVHFGPAAPTGVRDLQAMGML